MKGFIARVALIALAITGFAPASVAQTFPSQSMKIIVAFPPGGATDMVTRAVGMKLADSLKQSVVIENRPGGAGHIGMGALARAPADGHTLGVGTLSNLAINPALSKSAPYDARKDFAPIALMTEVHIVMCVPASLPVDSLAGLVEWAKKNPTKMNFASNGPGSSGHMVGEVLKRKFGFEMEHVPSGGDAPILNALMGGHIQLGILAAPPAAEFVKAGTVKAIAITSTRRSPALPGVPTLAELGVNEISAETWFGLAAPAATPQHIVELLNREINKALADPDTKRLFNNAGLEPAQTSLTEFRDYVLREQDKWAAIVKSLGLAVEN